jgi:TRAP-type C4-dicarboxylate transport system permease small subunit
MTGFVRSITALSRFFGGIAAVMVVVSLVLVCQMVVMEFVLGVPSPWPSEIVSYLIMGVTFLGTPYVFASGGHVAIGLFSGHSRAPRSRLRRAVVSLISLGFALGFTATGIAVLTKAVSEGWQADDPAWIALWIPYLTFPLGAALLSLQCVAELAAILTGHPESETEAADAAMFPD